MDKTVGINEINVMDTAMETLFTSVEKEDSVMCRSGIELLLSAFDIEWIHKVKPSSFEISALFMEALNLSGMVYEPEDSKAGIFFKNVMESFYTLMPPDLKKQFQEKFIGLFPGLKPNYYDQNGEPLYDISTVADTLGVDEKYVMESGYAVAKDEKDLHRVQ